VQSSENTRTRSTGKPYRTESTAGALQCRTRSNCKEEGTGMEGGRGGVRIVGDT